MSGPKLTSRDMSLIRSALNHAMDERESLADAYSYEGPTAKKALAQARAFEKLHRKLFGCQSARQAHCDRFNATPLVSINDLAEISPSPNPHGDRE